MSTTFLLVPSQLTLSMVRLLASAQYSLCITKSKLNPVGQMTFTDTKTFRRWPFIQAVSIRPLPSPIVLLQMLQNNFLQEQLSYNCTLHNAISRHVPLRSMDNHATKFLLSNVKCNSTMIISRHGTDHNIATNIPEKQIFHNPVYCYWSWNYKTLDNHR